MSARSLEWPNLVNRKPPLPSRWPAASRSPMYPVRAVASARISTRRQAARAAAHSGRLLMSRRPRQQAGDQCAGHRQRPRSGYRRAAGQNLKGWQMRGRREASAGQPARPLAADRRHRNFFSGRPRKKGTFFLQIFYNAEFFACMAYPSQAGDRILVGRLMRPLCFQGGNDAANAILGRESIRQPGGRVSGRMPERLVAHGRRKICLLPWQQGWPV